MINFYFFTVGSCIASFLGLVIDRFPESSIIRPRSHCDHCQQTLRPLDLIPILSQVLFRFRCRYCQSPLPYWYALFEAWSGLLFLLCYQGLLPISHLFVLLGSCVLAIYDLRSMEYPLLLWLVLHALCLFFHQPYPLDGSLSLLRSPVSCLLHRHWSRGLSLTSYFFFDPLSCPSPPRHARGFPHWSPGLPLKKRKRPDSFCSLSFSELSGFTVFYNF